MNRRKLVFSDEDEDEAFDANLQELQRSDMPDSKWGYDTQKYADRMLLHSVKRERLEPYKPHPLIIPQKTQNYIGAVLQALSAIPSIREIFATKAPQYVQTQSLSDQLTTYFMMQKYFDRGVPIAIDGPVQALIRKNTVWGSNRMQDAGELLKELLTILVEEVQVGKHIPDHGTTNQLRRRFNRFGGVLRRKVTNITQNSMDMIRGSSKDENRPEIRQLEERPWDGDGGSSSNFRLRRTQLPIQEDEDSNSDDSARVFIPKRTGSGKGSAMGMELIEKYAEASQASREYSQGSFPRRGSEQGTINALHIQRYAEAWEEAGSRKADLGGVIGAFTHYIQGSTVESITCNSCQHRRAGGEIPFNVLDVPPFILLNGTLGSIKDSLTSYAALKGYKGGGNLWCKTCKFWFGHGRNEGTVRMEIEIQPRILFLKIDRFTPSKKVVHQFEKIPHHVEFEEKLDIAPYVYQGGLKPGDKLEYELCAVIEHVGSRLNNASTFRTYCKGQAKKNKKATWFECLDSTVKTVTPEQVFRAQAYILVYEKTDFTWGEYIQEREEKEATDKAPPRFGIMRTKSTGALPRMRSRSRGPRNSGTSNAGSSGAGPSSAGPSNAGPSSAGPSNAGPSNAGPSNTGPSNAALVRNRRNGPGPNNAGPTGRQRTGPGPSNGGLPRNRSGARDRPRKKN